jgi:hypothetical protein
MCAFRTANGPAFRAAFTRVLELAPHLRLTQVGPISVDGTKIAAHASKHAAVSYPRAGEMIGQLELAGQELMTRAEQADAREATATLDLPAEPRRREQGLTALQRARQVIEERADARAAGKKPRGPDGRKKDNLQTQVYTSFFKLGETSVDAFLLRFVADGELFRPGDNSGVHSQNRN